MSGIGSQRSDRGAVKTYVTTRSVVTRVETRGYHRSQQESLESFAPFDQTDFVAQVDQCVATSSPHLSKLFEELMRALSLCSFALMSVVGVMASAAELELNKGDHICLVGNALGERMQHQNQWESLLHQRFPELELTVRNLCFPGDEPLDRIRSENFGEPDKHLSHSAASVVMYLFGFNESFGGKKGLKKFTTDMTKLVEETKSKDYGKGAPRIVLVSPIAFENTGDPNLPDGTAENERIKMYTEALRKSQKRQTLVSSTCSRRRWRCSNSRTSS